MAQEQEGEPYELPLWWNMLPTLQAPAPIQPQLSPDHASCLQFLHGQLRHGDRSEQQPPTPEYTTQTPTQTPMTSLPPGSRLSSLPITPSPLRQIYPSAALAQTPSPQYQNPYITAHDAGADIPLEQSTSVWITNLPPTCSYTELLSSVRSAGHTGKIYATVINPPQDAHTTSAAKIVFFDVAAKTRLLAYASTGQFTVGSFQPHVVANRIRTAQRVPGPESRVLIISGPVEVVNVRSMLGFFQSYCAFDLEYARPWTAACPGRATIEWAFGSYRCQAERVYKAIIENARAAYVGGGGDDDETMTNDFADVEVRWGSDPCDQPWL
ncbi:hypothetical protein F5Y08DRAFT_143209 [Xylaria arbuscula]|nr:hypothetical protein F5Y08DRAFT_143209 [Xylaria arbuscula]